MDHFLDAVRRAMNGVDARSTDSALQAVFPDVKDVAYKLRDSVSELLIYITYSYMPLLLLTKVFIALERDKPVKILFPVFLIAAGLSLAFASRMASASGEKMFARSLAFSRKRVPSSLRQTVKMETVQERELTQDECYSLMYSFIVSDCIPAITGAATPQARLLRDLSGLRRQQKAVSSSKA